MKKFLSIFETIGLLSSSSIIAVPTLSNIKTNSILKKKIKCLMKNLILY
ncbi:hypothetical protein [Spiroplasma endosymbiont of Polydrusus pterygomalis]